MKMPDFAGAPNMTTGKQNVTIKTMPSSSDVRTRQLFLEEVEAFLAQRRPRLVLDCSSLQCLDEAAIHLMLHCLEEALKRNGDVKVAALAPDAETAFAASGLNRLFSVYTSAAEAAASFHQVSTLSAPSAAAVSPLPAAQAA